MANPSPMETDESEELWKDPEIWEDLMEELQDYIRSKLPFNSVVKFLAVSKSWKVEIESSSSFIPEDRKRRSRGLVLQLCSRPFTAYISGKRELFPLLPGLDGSCCACGLRSKRSSWFGIPSPKESATYEFRVSSPDFKTMSSSE
ncbi:hypothetical protein R1flu_025005 [Riccia fluitans]|uniref:F-box domain-containing protein n=1 Tax=Riccia fluitans TaxID=41844 RepID=A0ABD1XWI3_9MARC